MHDVPLGYNMQLPNECDFAAYNHKLELPNGEKKLDKGYNPKPFRNHSKKKSGPIIGAG